jgi:hypothetical protein
VTTMSANRATMASTPTSNISGEISAFGINVSSTRVDFALGRNCDCLFRHLPEAKQP